MNTKNKIIAILMASIVAMAVGVPMAMGTDATTSATVGNAAPEILEIEITPDDDGSTTGVQVNPVADGTKTVTVRAKVKDTNGKDDINTVKITGISPAVTGVTTPLAMSFDSNVDVTTDWYKTTFDMPFSDKSTTYTVTVTVTDKQSATASTPTKDFTYTLLTSITVTNVVFGALNAGESSSGKYSTVTNKGNANVTFADETPAGYDNNVADGLQWSDMTCTSPADTIVDDHISTAWSASTPINRGAASSSNVPFTLAVPAGTLSGSYSGTITFTPTGVA